MIDVVIADTFKSAYSSLFCELGFHPDNDVLKPKDPYFRLADQSGSLTGPPVFWRNTMRMWSIIEPALRRCLPREAPTF